MCVCMRERERMCFYVARFRLIFCCSVEFCTYFIYVIYTIIKVKQRHNNIYEAHHQLFYRWARESISMSLFLRQWKWQIINYTPYSFCLLKFQIVERLFSTDVIRSQSLCILSPTSITCHYAVRSQYDGQLNTKTHFPNNISENRKFKTENTDSHTHMASTAIVNNKHITWDSQYYRWG